MAGSARRPAGLRVAVVGATGLVGRELLCLLESRRFPAGEIRPFSSGRAAAAVRLRDRAVLAPAPDERALLRADLVFLVSSDEVARRWGRRLAAAGVWVLDDSAAFRLAPDVPLVIPEVNPGALAPDKRLVAGPNCTVTGPAVAGLPLHRRFRARRVRAASYQAVSGAGKAALAEFQGQLRRAAGRLKGRDLLAPLPSETAVALPRPIALNVFPQVGSFGPDGSSGEEAKVREELRKLWAEPGLEVSATTVRVPVLRGHSLALWLEFERPAAPARAAALLRETRGVRLWPEGDYPTPREVGGTEPVHVARVRRGSHSRELALWVVSDNLLKGAALNSVQVAELLLRKGWLRPS